MDVLGVGLVDLPLFILRRELGTVGKRGCYAEHISSG